MAATAKRTDEKLWQKVKDRVTKGSKGGDAGEWSARKAQMAVQEYKKAGGGYEGKKTEDNHLRQWTEEEWGTKSGKESGETGERYLPKKARESLSDGEYARTTAAKRRDTAKGKQFSRQPEDVARKTAKARDTGHAAPKKAAPKRAVAATKKPAAPKRAATTKRAASATPKRAAAASPKRSASTTPKPSTAATAAKRAPSKRATATAPKGKAAPKRAASTAPKRSTPAAAKRAAPAKRPTASRKPAAPRKAPARAAAATTPAAKRTAKPAAKRAPAKPAPKKGSTR